MKNRNNKHIENTMDEIAYHWNLSINEEEILDSFLILLKDGDVNKLKQIEYLLNGEYEELLKIIPDNVLIRHCENRLGMVTKEYMNEVLNEDYDFSLGNIHLSEICQVAENKGYKVLKKENNSIVEDMQIEEIKELFLSLSWAEKEELLNKLRKL